MRNQLAPYRKARYIPWKRASQRAKPSVQMAVSLLLEALYRAHS